MTATTLVPCTRVTVTGAEAPPEYDHAIVALCPRATEDAPEAVSAGRVTAAGAPLARIPALPTADTSTE